MFSDEFEFQASNDKKYYVSVMLLNDGSVESFKVTDELGDNIDADDTIYDEISDEVGNREYQLESHDGNFDFYDQQLDHFGNDKLDINNL